MGAASRYLDSFPVYVLQLRELSVLALFQLYSTTGPILLNLALSINGPLSAQLEIPLRPCARACYIYI